MRRLNGKRFILGLMALILCVTACVPAFASVGDRILVRETTLDGYLPMTVRKVVPCGDGFIVIKYSDTDMNVERYADVKAEPEVFVLAEEERIKENCNSNVESWFSWKGELYGFETRYAYSEESSSSEVLVRHVRLENGKVILEESGLPELDLSGVLEGEEGDQYMSYVCCAFEMDDKLFLGAYGDAASYNLEIIDLNDGSCSEIEIAGEVTEIVPGPEGTVLIVRWEWDADTSTNTVKVNSLDLKSEEEKEIGVYPGMENTYINPCYDRNTDTLYIIKDGEIWAMPHFDMEQAVAVNDCPNIGDGMILLPDGFVLVWMCDTVMIKNTDPSQRGSITLRICDGGYGSTMNDTVYAMNNKRGDISVVVKSVWEDLPDIVQAMMKQDGSTDIYSLPMDNSQFAALRKKGYLQDLSANEKIVESTSRLYPYIRDAVTQDGKIIGVPVCFEGRTPGVHMEAWKGIGGTEEELPKTWSQFFDWLESLPERLEGKNVAVVPDWETRESFRGTILEVMLNQYETLMERKGDTDYYFATPEMCELVRRLDGLDYDALQIRNGNDEDEYYDDYDERTALLDNNTSTLFYDGGTYVPLPLSFSEEEDPVLPVQVSIAFMNPYSEHPQEAMEFLALATENLFGLDQYAAYTDRTEPVHYSGYESMLRYYQERIDKLKEQIEKTEDGNDRETLEEILQDAEADLADAEESSWIICSEQIESYKKMQGYFRAKGYSFLNVLYASENDDEDSNEYDKLFFDSFGKEPAEVLGMLDKKVRMIRMEGE